jgi:hypothetical protein
MDWITQAEEMETQEQNLASAIQVRVRTNGLSHTGSSWPIFSGKISLFFVFE